VIAKAEHFRTEAADTESPWDGGPINDLLLQVQNTGRTHALADIHSGKFENDPLPDGRPNES
jgi:hypothetical protein